jgi:hypothetical protein
MQIGTTVGAVLILSLACPGSTRATESEPASPVLQTPTASDKGFDLHEKLEKLEVRLQAQQTLLEWQQERPQELEQATRPATPAPTAAARALAGVESATETVPASPDGTPCSSVSPVDWCDSLSKRSPLPWVGSIA